jgi:hypothetical protein
MTLLNRASNGHVPSMVVLWRAARVMCPAPRAKLESMCRPRVNTDQSKMQATFATWRALGMFDGGDELVQLGSPFDAIDPADIEALRTAVLELLLRPDNSPALLATDLSKETEASRASDFVRVASWALAQDPYRLASGNQERALDQASAQGLSLFMGDGRWASFQEWAYFVGLGVPTKYGFVVSPARAVREALSGERPRVALPANKDVLLTTFLEDLARVIPVVDGGAYRVQIDDVLRAKGHGIGSHQVSPSLSGALMQLHHEGEIELTDRPGDVAVRLSLIGRAGRVVETASYIRRGTARRERRLTALGNGGRA